MSAVMTSRSMPSRGTKYSFCRLEEGGAACAERPAREDMVVTEAWNGRERAVEEEGGRRLRQGGRRRGEVGEWEDGIGKMGRDKPGNGW